MGQTGYEAETETRIPHRVTIAIYSKILGVPGVSLLSSSAVPEPPHLIQTHSHAVRVLKLQTALLERDSFTN